MKKKKQVLDSPANEPKTQEKATRKVKQKEKRNKNPTKNYEPRTKIMITIFFLCFIRGTHIKPVDIVLVIKPPHGHWSVCCMLIWKFSQWAWCLRRLHKLIIIGISQCVRANTHTHTHTRLFDTLNLMANTMCVVQKCSQSGKHLSIFLPFFVCCLLRFCCRKLIFNCTYEGVNCCVFLIWELIVVVILIF